MQKTAVTSTFVALVLAAVLAYVINPAVRAWVNRRASDCFGWSAAARQDDPSGFLDHAGAQLREDLRALEVAREKLTGELRRLGDTSGEQQILEKMTQEELDSLQQAYDQAQDCFPLYVNGTRYDRQDAEARLRVLKAECRGYAEGQAKVERFREEATRELEALTARIQDGEAQLTLLRGRHELAQARNLSANEDRILGQIDDVVTVSRLPRLPHAAVSLPGGASTRPSIRAANRGSLSPSQQAPAGRKRFSNIAQQS